MKRLIQDLIHLVFCFRLQEERIKELLITFGQLKFYALQKDEEGKSARALVHQVDSADLKATVFGQILAARKGGKVC